MKIAKNIFLHLLLLVVILQCHSLPGMLIPNMYVLIAILGIFCVLLALETGYQLRRDVLTVAATYLIGMLILFLVGDFKYLGFLFSVVTVFLIFIVYLSNKNNLMQALEAFTNIMLTISAISLFFFVFASCLDWIEPTDYYRYTEIGWGTRNYYDFFHLYCEGQTIRSFGYEGVRNIALFAEAPMFVYPMSLALYYEVFLREKSPRKWAIAVMVVTMVTTFSTTGYLVLLAITALKLYERIKDSSFKRYVIPTLVVVAVVGVIYILIDKFARGTASASTRMDDLMGTIKCFLANPIVGIGFENMEGLTTYYQLDRTGLSLSMGLTGIFAYGGILWGIWYVTPYVIAVKRYVLNPESRSKMGFVLLSAVLLFVTVVQSRVLCTMINAICWLFILDTRNTPSSGKAKDKWILENRLWKKLES